VHRYIKGARSERELLNTFHSRGYSVIRSAGSGVNALGPDIIALKNGNAICIECKAWDRGSLSLDYDQFEKLLEWESNTSFPTYVAWRMNNKGWFFVKLSEFTKNEKSYTVTMKRTVEINRVLESVVGGPVEVQPLRPVNSVSPGA
jgi:Holliday junction resolvase